MQHLFPFVVEHEGKDLIQEKVVQCVWGCLRLWNAAHRHHSTCRTQSRPDLESAEGSRGRPWRNAARECRRRARWSGTRMRAREWARSADENRIRKSAFSVESGDGVCSSSCSGALQLKIWPYARYRTAVSCRCASTVMRIPGDDFRYKGGRVGEGTKEVGMTTKKFALNLRQGSCSVAKRQHRSDGPCPMERGLERRLGGYVANLPWQ